MADPTDRDADRLDDWLNRDADGRGDDLTAFADRLLRDAAMPDQPAHEPTRAQRDRIRARVFGAPATTKASETMTATTFAPNGASSAPIPIREPERPAPSKFSMLLTAALVALIAVTGFGLLGGSLDPPLGGDDPAPTGAPALAWSPIASPTAKTDCSRDQMVSVFAGEVPEILRDTAHATLRDGTLTWHCGGASEQLATNVERANGVFWPGVIVTVTQDDTVRLLNIASDTKINLDRASLLGDDGKIDYQRFVWSHGPEPWVIVPANADHTDWRIIDVRSMESLLLSDELGEPFATSTFPAFGQITGTDIAVVTWRSTLIHFSATPIVGGDEYMPQQRALVLPRTIENRRWVEITGYRLQSSMEFGSSQLSAVSRDGRLLAYTTETDGDPAIRVEEAVSGDRVADVPLDSLSTGTRFMLSNDGDRLVVSDSESLAIRDLSEGTTIVEEPVDFDIQAFYPTADRDTVLAATSGTAVRPIDVRDGSVGEPWRYTPPVITQLFGDYELPRYLVRVVSDELGGTPAIIQLVDPATGEVVLESDPVDAHPIQIVSFTTWVRNGGEEAVVPIGYNRAVVLNAATGETWQIAAPSDDDRLWHFFPSYDGRFVTAYPEPPQGTTGTDRNEYWVAPLEPNAQWVPIESDGGESAMMMVGTPAG